MNALEIIQDANILKESDWNSLTKIKSELAQTWETVQVFRTRTEMIVSVLNDMKHPTPDSKYWQAVREQNVMFDELVNLSYEYRKKIVEVKKLTRDIEESKDDLDIELKKIEIEQTEWHLRNMEKIAHSRIREVLEWSKIKGQLVSQLTYGDKDVNAHQLEAMKKRFTMEAKLVNEHTAIADKRNVLALADMVNKV